MGDYLPHQEHPPLYRFVWCRLATYFHWVGRTGDYLPLGHAQIENNNEELQDVVEGHRLWSSRNMRIADFGHLPSLNEAP